MNYVLIQCVNGNFSVISEHGNDLKAAKVAFHDRCRILWNTDDVITGTVTILDEQLNIVEGKIEYISHSNEEESTNE